MKISRSQLAEVSRGEAPTGASLPDDFYHPGHFGLPALATPVKNTVIQTLNGRFEMFRTVLYDGNILGWDNCHACANHVRVCKCPAVTPSPWTVRNALDYQPPVPTYEVWKPAPMPEPREAPKPRERPAERAHEPVLKPPTLAEIQEAAHDEATDLTERLRKRLRRS